jgi:hypothetical protein
LITRTFPSLLIKNIWREGKSKLKAIDNFSRSYIKTYERERSPGSRPLITGTFPSLHFAF